MLFQKKQTGYQGYQASNNSSNRTKVIILLSLIGLTIFVGVISIITKEDISKNAAQKNSSLKEYTSTSRAFRLSLYIPKELELKESGFDLKLSLPQSNQETGQTITISKFLRADGKDDLGKVTTLALKNIEGVDMPGLTSRRERLYERDVLIVDHKDKPNMQDYYVVSEEYIWKLSFEWGSKDKSLSALAPQIATSLKAEPAPKNIYLED